MQLSSDAHIPDGLLAANVLLSEKPRQGVPSWNPALHQGIDEANCTAAIGLRASQSLNRIGSRYTGKERDSESGLDYFGARYYGSSMGRFMSPDPGWFFASDIGDPQSLNQYAYVDNNPLKFTDPDGMHFECTTTTISYTGDDGNTQSSSSKNCKWVDDPGDLMAGLSSGINVNSIAPSKVQPLSTSARATPSSGCIQPTAPQKAARSLYGWLAGKLGKTVGAGLGASGGVGSGIGVGGSASAQLVASPDGTSGLAVTLPAMPVNLISSGPGGNLGSGAMGGPQVSISNAGTIQDLSGPFYGGGGGFGGGEAAGAELVGGYNSSGRFIWQGAGAIGYGAGGFGAMGQKTNTTVTPFCK
jgi:RHS repeat-associated protein